ncbi:MAG: pentapeptide repeat-containing protein [Coleofasciculaceae cyanobacterium]
MTRQHFLGIPSILLNLVLFLVAAILMFGITTTPAVALDYNRENLVEADFSNRDLTDSEFTKANLRKANLSNSNLQRVSFFATNLEAANLEGADLSFATLDSARFVRANLKNAILVGAFASNARFEGANIEGADFTDVLLRRDIQDKLCLTASGTNSKTGRETRETLFCD